MSKKRIGNTTDSPRNTEKITKYSKLYKEEIEEYERFVEGRRRNRIYNQENLLEYWEKLGEYIADCQSRKEPVTIAGVILALGIDRDTWYRARNKEMDYILGEFINIHNVSDDQVTVVNGLPYFNYDNQLDSDGAVLLIPWSYLAEKAALVIQSQLERNCYTNKGNPAGSIFGLKAQFDWKEDSTPQHVVQNLVIADSEQAKKAMQMLTNG